MNTWVSGYSPLPHLPGGQSPHSEASKCTFPKHQVFQSLPIATARPLHLLVALLLSLWLSGGRHIAPVTRLLALLRVSYEKKKPPGLQVSWNSAAQTY